MNIVLDSKRVLNAIYNLLTDSSFTLVVKIPLDSMATDLNISRERLNLCIHYLIVSGYITGDFTYYNQPDATKEVIFTALGINKVENTTL